MRAPRGFWPVWATVALDLLGFGMIIPFLPLYAERYGATPAMVGILFSVYSLGQLVFSPVWGRVSDRIGRKPVLIVTLIGSAIGSLTVGLAGGLAVILVGRIIDGVSGASVGVARAIAADIAEPEERPRLMGLLGAAFGIGFVLGPAFGGLVGLAGDRVPFLVAGGLAAANAVITAFRLPETHVARERPSLSLRAAFRPGVAPVVMATLGAVTAFAAFESTFTLLANDRFAMSGSQIALMFAGVGAVLVLTQGALVGPVAGVLGEVPATMAGMTVTAAGLGVVALATSLPPLFLGLGLMAFGQGVSTPTLSSVVAGLADQRDVGAVMGVQQSAGGMGRVVGPLVGGALFAVSPAGTYLAAGAVMIVALAVLAPLSRRAEASAGYS